MRRLLSSGQPMFLTRPVEFFQHAAPPHVVEDAIDPPSRVARARSRCHAVSASPDTQPPPFAAPTSPPRSRDYGLQVFAPIAPRTPLAPDQSNTSWPPMKRRFSD